MPRLIVLLLALIALALLAVQNLATSVALVVLSNTLPAIPLGILLVATIGIGALLTLFLYGLIGLKRPPESKYKPMGRRVPYPEGPGTTLPSTNPSTPSTSSTSSYSPEPSSYTDSSSAFVSEPTPASDPKPADSYTPNSYASDSYVGDSYTSDPYTTDSSYTADPYPEQTQIDTNPSADSYSGTKENLTSRFVQQPVAGIRSVFGKKKDRSAGPSEPLKPVGDDWGERRTTEHKNTWELSESGSKAEEGIKGLINFGRNVGTNAGKLAEDIATGWNNSNQGRASASVDGYESENYYADDSYYSGNRSDDYDAAPPDDLDQGWENFDHYDETAPRESSGERGSATQPAKQPERQIYGDSLYGEPAYPPEDTYEGPYEEGPYEEVDPDEGRDEIGPDGVYEADYRVIVPPSKPLDSD